MTHLHLLRLPLSLSEVHKQAGIRSLGWATRGGANRAVFDEGCALHHLLSEAFGKGVTQPFRLMVAPGQKNASLYAYTPHSREALIETLAACALPECAALFPAATLETKALPQSWTPGRRLAFDLRARPTRRLLKPLGAFGKKGAEVDAFLVEALRRNPEAPPPPANNTDQTARQEVYIDWLAERLAGAAELVADTTRLVRFSRTKVVRNKGKAVSEGPDATLQGELTITDPARFAKCLTQGVGRHAAYGYGMLLLRPPARGR